MKNRLIVHLSWSKLLLVAIIRQACRGVQMEEVGQTILSTFYKMGLDKKIKSAPTKVEVEFQEIDDKRDREVAWEIGDCLLALANLARHFNLSAEDLLNQANQRFKHRFFLVEKLAHKQKITLSEVGIDVLEDLWQQAKKITG